MLLLALFFCQLLSELNGQLPQNFGMMGQTGFQGNGQCVGGACLNNMGGFGGMGNGGGFGGMGNGGAMGGFGGMGNRGAMGGFGGMGNGGAMGGFGGMGNGGAMGGFGGIGNGGAMGGFGGMGNRGAMGGFGGMGNRGAMGGFGGMGNGGAMGGFGGMGNGGAMGGFGGMGNGGNMGAFGGMGNGGAMGNTGMPFPGNPLGRMPTPFGNRMFGRSNFPGMTSPFQGMQQNNMIPGMTNNAMGTNGGMLGANNVMPANGMMTVSVRNGNGGTTTVSVPIACTQTRDIGRCATFARRFYFNRFSGRCEEFTYSGCGGNNNNFATIAQCQQTCEMPTVG